MMMIDPLSDTNHIRVLVWRTATAGFGVPFEPVLLKARRLAVGGPLRNQGTR